MLYIRNLRKKIKGLHERCLRIIYNKICNFEEIIEKDNSVSIQHRNIQTLVIEMYKIANGLPPEIMNEIFQGRQESHDSLSYASQFTVATIRMSLQWNRIFVIYKPYNAGNHSTRYHADRLSLRIKKNKLRNGSLVTDFALYAKFIYHKLISNRINFKKEKVKGYSVNEQILRALHSTEILMAKTQKNDKKTNWMFFFTKATGTSFPLCFHLTFLMPFLILLFGWYLFICLFYFLLIFRRLS